VCINIKKPEYRSAATTRESQIQIVAVTVDVGPARTTVEVPPNSEMETITERRDGSHERATRGISVTV
jgi:hypothetical protein